MVVLKTNEHAKVNKHIKIITDLWNKDLNINQKQTFELMCLYYDYIIRKNEINNMTEDELTIRLYNILSNEAVIFTKNDFDITFKDEFGIEDYIIETLKKISSDLNNIMFYLATVESKYGVKFVTYRNIRITHMIVNIFKYGLHIDKQEAFECNSNMSNIDFLQCYISKISKDLTVEDVCDVSLKARKLLIAFTNKRERKDVFKYVEEQI